MNQEVESLIPDWLSIQDSDFQIQSHLVVIGTTSLRKEDVVLLKHLLDKHSIEHHVNNETDKVIDYCVSISLAKAVNLYSEILNFNILNKYDVALLQSNGLKKKLLICDMDSTIVKTETLDEIAKETGLGEQVSQITDKAMRGDIDFNTALIERVKLLKDLPTNMLDEIADKTELNEGAESLISKAKLNGIRTVLVSGGFNPIVNTVAEKLGFDRYVCNRMEIENGKLTGNVELPIVNSETKLSVLKEECRKLNIEPEQVCAIGDGANDLPMITTAGLGISYYGKPVLRKATAYQINVTDLNSALYMMGIFDT